jgi:predicted ribosomally synthesized peptide with nif11-like leader
MPIGSASELLSRLSDDADFREELESKSTPEEKRRFIRQEGYKIKREDVEALQRGAARRFLGGGEDEFSDLDDPTLITTVLGAFWNDAAFWNPSFWAEAFWVPTPFWSPSAPEE